MGKILYVIPARGGSKGIPGKNIKLLGGKPLICRSIDAARDFAKDEDICVTTDSDEIISAVEQYGLEVPFKRPASLATDTSSSYDVLIHALDYYESIDRKYDTLVLLQPTSPFRKKGDISKMLSMMRNDIDMVVSVKKAETNPYYNCYIPDSSGFLQKFMPSPVSITGRQTKLPLVYEKNGSVYIINVSSLRKRKMSDFDKVLFYEMTQEYSVDIDEPLDWIFAEALLNNKLVK